MQLRGWQKSTRCRRKVSWAFRRQIHFSDQETFYTLDRGIISCPGGGGGGGYGYGYDYGYDYAYSMW